MLIVTLQQGDYVHLVGKFFAFKPVWLNNPATFLFMFSVWHSMDFTMFSFD